MHGSAYSNHNSTTQATRGVLVPRTNTYVCVRGQLEAGHNCLKQKLISCATAVVITPLSVAFCSAFSNLGAARRDKLGACYARPLRVSLSLVVVDHPIVVNGGIFCWGKPRTKPVPRHNTSSCVGIYMLNILGRK